MPVTLLDTGVLWAALDSSDHQHRNCADFLETVPGQLLLPTTVLTETCWHVEKHLGAKAEADFLDYIAQSDIDLVEVDKSDLVAASSVVRQYASLRIGLVDASVIALAQRLDVDRIATLDRRHFATVRPQHVDYFTLLPESLR